MIINDEVTPVFHWFEDLKEGAVFISEAHVYKGEAFIKVPAAKTDDEVSEEFNAIYLNDGNVTWFYNDDPVMEVHAELTISPKH